MTEGDARFSVEPLTACIGSAVNQSGMAPPQLLAYGFDVRALIHSPKQFVKTLFTEPGSPEAARLSYVSFSNGAH